MKLKNLFLTGLLFCCLYASGQVFSTAKVLSPLHFSAGIAPAYYNENRALFLFAEIGLIKGIDFELEYGIIEFTDYYGANLEWRLYSGKPLNISLTTGFHSYGDVALDVAANFSFRIINNVALYTGIDSDYIFENEVYVPLWLPLGAEIKLNKNVAFLFEGEIPVNDYAFPIIDGGLRVYF